MAFGSQRAPQGHAERIETGGEREGAGGREKSHREVFLKPPAQLLLLSKPHPVIGWRRDIYI